MTESTTTTGDARRGQPLRELSQLLGVEVTDVGRSRLSRGSNPQPDANAWRLMLAGRGGDDLSIASRDFRSANWPLHQWLHSWGRAPELPLLTKADGRRALRLMHEHIESKPEHDNIKKEQDR